VCFRTNGPNKEAVVAAETQRAEGGGASHPQQVPMSRSTPNLQQLVSIFYLGEEPVSGGGTGGHQPPPPSMLPPPSRSESVGSLPASSSSGLSSWGSIQDASKGGQYYIECKWYEVLRMRSR